MIGLSAFGCGFLFAIGLVLSGMTQPSKIIGFLDITGAWDPQLAWVMAGAVGTGWMLFPWVLRQPRPLLGDGFVVPPRVAIDARLLIGAALFGIGWGLSGYCPGPALVALITLNPGVFVFVLSLLLGLKLGR